MTPLFFEKTCIIGIGLIGSSVARALKKYKLTNHISISCNDPKILKEAEELSLGNQYFLKNKDAVKDADLIFIAAPVGAYKKIGEEIQNHLKKGAILTDVGSTKSSVVQELAPFLSEKVHFIPAHPVAGTEYSGPKAGFPELFQERWCILTPQKKTDKDALNKVKKIWEIFGSQISIMTPDHHDLVLAAVSHLPHIIAFNLVRTANDLEQVTKSEVISYSASGFRDFTRLASSDPTMWRDICLANKNAILELLARFSEDLAILQRAIRWEDEEALFDIFTQTRKIRQSIIEAGQDIDKPNFGRK